jgi:phospholipase C
MNIHGFCRRGVPKYFCFYFVSHPVYDHSSILKFIETKFNLPALTHCDANVDGMFELFDFEQPQQETPNLPRAAIDWGQFFTCTIKEVGSVINVVGWINSVKSWIAPYPKID